MREAGDTLTGRAVTANTVRGDSDWLLRLPKSKGVNARGLRL